MITGIIKIKIHVPWVHSLKGKRLIVKSICSRVHNKFNVSVAEVDEQDVHKIIVLGISYVTNNNAHADSIADNVINFIENSTEGDLINIEREKY
jgi:uncharacterized protein YlxP (DUF503 family)